MAVRVYILAKEIGVSSKELIDFINTREYGLNVKSASSSVPTLYEDVIKADVLAMKNAKAPSKEVEASGAAKEAPESNPEGQSGAGTSEAPEPKAAEAKPAGEVAANAGVGEAKAPAEPAAPAEKAPISEAANVAALQVKAPAPAPKIPPVLKRPPMPAPKIPLPPRPAQKIPAVKEPASRPVQPEVIVRAAPKTPPMPSRAGFGVKAPSVPPRVGFAPKTPSVPPRFPMAPKPDSAAPAEASKAPEGKLKIIQIKPPIVVRDFAKAMDLKSFRLISELMDMGIFASMNLSIEEDVARKIAARHGFELDIKHRGETQARQLQAAQEKLARKMELEDDSKNLEPRPPIVCILGHVDHGKTTLLDTIRHTNVVSGEAGGITQHTAAYQVELNGKKITFLDTPGHAAFSKMRERGANVTDIAILVVAADDGFMPQTDEALNFAQKAGVPIVVAINKIDAKGANLDKVKQQMQKRGIAPEEWGGDTLCCGVSALKGTNIDELLELVLLQAEMMELKANPKRDARGVVIESQIEQGRGSTATVIVRAGTLKAGDVIVAKGNWCKVRAMLDDRGGKIQKAAPSTPALVMGWSGAPEAGDEFTRVSNDREARRMVEEYEDARRKEADKAGAAKPVSIEDLMAAIESKDQKVFKCIVKSDVSGTVEALVACLKDIKSSKVELEIIGSSVGQITKNDIDFASTASASIVAFNVKQENGVSSLAKHENVEIISHNIIYELINQVRDAMKGLLDPELRENKLGAAEVRQIFNVSKGGKVAGCMVTEGVIKRDKFVRVLRSGKEISKGRVLDLKRFKEDVSEVRAGYECGISVTGFNDYQSGDVIECYEILEVRPDL
ncbi:MAG: translation initiation factor IF-2 [Opitutales bacterium]|nr:translation initiation factor IF-2 [Opitutales bacterium]